MAGWAFPADGALAHSAARGVLGCATAAWLFLDEVVALQIFAAGRVTLTCLHVWFVWETKLGSQITVLGEICSPIFHTVQEILVEKYESQFVFLWWYFLKCSCHWNPVDILAFESLSLPLCLICKMEESFPVLLELIRKARFLITLGSLHVSDVCSCFP